MGGRGGGSPASRQGPEAGTTGPVALSAPDAVLAAYATLANQFDNEWVILSSLRGQLSGLTREQQDSALMSLLRERKIRLIPEENQQALTQSDWNAAINVSGEPKHLIGIPK